VPFYDQRWSANVILPDFANIQIVLVNTSHPGNIGSTARALKNMGIPNLRLVDPRVFPSEEAVWLAASATDVLDQARVFADLQSAVADCSLVIGTSARSRSMPWPMLTPRQCASHVVADTVRSKVALVFGREDSGLNNEELQMCHYHVQIPANEQYSSLNLAAAVMVICYEIRVAMLAAIASKDVPQPRCTGDFYDPDLEAEYWDVPKADNHQLELFYAHLERVLVDMEFHDPKNPRLLMPRLRRLFGRIRPDAMEVNILRGVLTYIDDHVRRANQNDTDGK
jgi:tRNA (cytidine32/uridine32-2'-O)-methyltransferase